MDFLRAVAHLQRELGDALFMVLIDPVNTGKLREFVQKLVDESLPTDVVIGGVVYEVMSLHEGDEEIVKGDVMLYRAKKSGANHGNSDRIQVLTNQKDVPKVLRGKVLFVFTDDQLPGDPERSCCVFWNGFRWVEDHCGPNVNLGRSCRVLRRKVPTNSEV